MLAVLALPSRFESLYRSISIFLSFLQVFACGAIFLQFNGADFQFVEKTAWIQLALGSMGNLSIDYFVGIDGLSAGLLLLTAIVMLLASIASSEITFQKKGYFALLLLLNTALMGVFSALDFFLFYLFYEFMLLPLYFLIGIWGGARKEYAAIKFFLYTLFGSVFMLLVIVALYFSSKDPVTGEHTLNMLTLANPLTIQPGSILGFGGDWSICGLHPRLLAFLIVFIAFAIKIPAVPLHTWLPDAHVEAPTPVSMILAGLVLKVGGYGIIRICYSIFPDAAAHYSTLIAGFGLLSIVYGALNALAATDLKRLVAYSSISHMGFVLLGIASLLPEGWNGATLQLFSHGILSAGLFYLVGIIYRRTGSREIAHFSGLNSLMPRYTVFVMILFFASLGLPGFSAFIAEALSLMGAFGSNFIPKWMAILSVTGIFLAAAYFLWALQRMFFGQVRLENESWKTTLLDLNKEEYAVLIPLALISLLLGVFPQLFFSVSNDSIVQFLNSLQIRP